MNIKAIKTEEDYNRALKRLEKIFHAPADSNEGDEAEISSILIENMKMNITQLTLRIQLRQLTRKIH